MRGVIPVVALAVTACVAGAVLFHLKSAPAGVSASNGSVAVGGNVGRDVIVNQFDAEKERKAKAMRFVQHAHRLCLNYVSQLSRLSMTDNHTTVIDFNGLYWSGDLASIVGSSAYETLHREQKALQTMSGDLFQISMENRGRGLASGLPEAEEKFVALREKLTAAIATHCRYLLTLG